MPSELLNHPELWGYKKGDLNVTPMIPFGSTVFAHVAAKNQAPLDFKCFETISMGRCKMRNSFTQPSD